MRFCQLEPCSRFRSIHYHFHGARLSCRVGNPPKHEHDWRLGAADLKGMKRLQACDPHPPLELHPCLVSVHDIANTLMLLEDKLGCAIFICLVFTSSLEHASGWANIVQCLLPAHRSLLGIPHVVAIGTSAELSHDLLRKRHFLHASRVS